jgi:hypothetical protein
VEAKKRLKVFEESMIYALNELFVLKRIKSKDPVGLFEEINNNLKTFSRNFSQNPNST